MRTEHKKSPWILLLPALCMMLCLLSGCAKEKAKEDDVIHIVATVFPEYDWVREITKGNTDTVKVDLLLDNGVDLHSYQPSADDILLIQNCDVFIYVGGESDEWVSDVLEREEKTDRTEISLMEELEGHLYEEEHKEGMQEEEEEEEEEHAYDEHVWLSLKNSIFCVEEIAKEIAEKDPEHADLYKTNAESYINELKELDKKYEEAVKASDRKVILFGDRFPFRYLLEDYGLDYYAAFMGCSAESEASFETVLFLVNKMDELGLNSISQLESADGSLCNTILSNSKNPNRPVLTWNSIQSVTNSDISAGSTYLGIMSENLEVLKEALK